MRFDEAPARALAVFAHPDDPEVACAGTLARWADAGSDVHVLIVNAGDKGSEDASVDPGALSARRAEEAKAAAAVLGLAGHEVLGVPDGETSNSPELRAGLVARIRALRPDVVVAPDPTSVFFGDTYVNHHDHRELGWAVLDACAPMAASPLYFADTGPAHRVPTLLLAGTLAPDCWIDIAAVLDRKVTALRCHESQLIDGVEFVDEVVRARASEAAEAASAAGEPGLAYAEGFRRLRLG